MQNQSKNYSFPLNTTKSIEDYIERMLAEVPGKNLKFS